MARIQISNDSSGRIIASFPYDPLLVSKVKTIDGRKWHPAEKHWSFPDSAGILEKISKVFEEKDVRIAPVLNTGTSSVRDTPSPPGPEGTFPDLHKSEGMGDK